MTQNNKKELLVRALLIALASGTPLAFPLSQMGYGTVRELSKILVIPTGVALVVASLILKRLRFGNLARSVVLGALAGTVATFALEAVRYPGFRLGFMPGNLPDLMGVLLLDRFALGPSTASTIAGYLYHFGNGAAFGVIYAMLMKGRSRWWAVPYGVAIGVGFMVSPVVQALGIGVFGKDFGWHFAATVLLAHAAFGATLGYFLGVPCPWCAIYEADSRSSIRPRVA